MSHFGGQEVRITPSGLPMVQSVLISAWHNLGRRPEISFWGTAEVPTKNTCV
jgi:hypothetical protein